MNNLMPTVFEALPAKPKVQQEFSGMTPQGLHHEFVRLGGMRFKLKNKMLAMLPEIYKSGIWKKYTATIEEYAGKFGDIANTTVKKRLRVQENLKDKPCLEAAIAKVGLHKVAMVAKITTPEMDQVMAEKLTNMSKTAVQSLSKELRAGQSVERANLQLSFDGGQATEGVLCQAIPLIKKIELDENSTFLFLKLKKKLGKNLSDKEFLKMILEEREKQERDSEVVLQRDEKSITGDSGAYPVSTFETKSPEPRYVKVAKKRQVLAPTNGKCIYPGCNLPYQFLHHTDRYSESKSHDSLIPLCKAHHEFMHNNLVENEKLQSSHWQLAVGEQNLKISRADLLYKKYRFIYNN